MNERIRELAKQAEDYAVAEYEKWTPTEDFSGVPHIRNIFNEKFAELIVKECIQVSGPEDSYTDEWFKAKADSVAKIKKHFGVEE